MEGKIVYQGKTKSGLNIIIRYPLFSDAKKMMEYINTLSDERTFIRFQGDILTLEHENDYLIKQLMNIKNKKSVLLLVFSDKELVGISDIHLLDKIEKHIGILGITVLRNFRGQGIGKILMETVLKETRNMPDLEIITLGVFANNTLAHNWYKKLGFKEYGTLPKGIKLENGYQDHIYMYKPVK